MRRSWLLLCIFLLSCIVPALEGVAQEKEDAGIPLNALSPPEGNTTFIDGITWCVARPGASQEELQEALDWACGLGMTDCRAIQEDGNCYEPDTLLSHSSYAFNSYYQQNGNSDIACNFGGTAHLTKHDPSYGKCLYAAPGPVSSAPRSFSWWNMAVAELVLLFYMRSLFN